MILTAKQIVTGDGKTILQDGAVLVQEGKIKAVATGAELCKKYPTEAITDFPNATLMPGLIDMHVHIGYYWTTDRNASPHWVALMAASTMKEALKKGVTTIRDVASPKGLVSAMKQAQSQGLLTMPQVISAHQGICMTGGHAWSLTTGVVEADGEVEIRKAIREQIKTGADFIKILSSHRSDTPEYTDGELAVCVDECHRLGRRVAVHAGTQPSIESCVSLGFDTIEHGTFMTKEQAVRMAQMGNFLIPTIVAYTYIYEEMEKERVATGVEFVGADKVQYDYFKRAALQYEHNFKNMYQAGVIMATGTDMVRKGAPTTPIDKEMEYFSRYGMPNIEVLAAATYNGALALGLEHEIGLVKEGYCANLILVDGDPVADITAVRKITATYLQGERVV